MTNATIISIYTLMQNDEEIGAKLAAIKNPEEAIAILAENGISVTADDLKDMITTLSADELPEELLDLVAGGGKVKDFFWGFFDGLNDGWNATKSFFSGLRK